MTETISLFLEHLSFGIELISALILVIGAVQFVVVLVGALTRSSVSISQGLQRARLKLGVYILAALEFLIVADILFTIVNRTLDDVIVLAIVAGVRTLVSYFLGKEIEALSAEESEALGVTHKG